MDPRFKTMKAHTAAKEQLLSLYVDAYFQILGHAGHFSQVSGFDLFCGPGRYEDGGIGSPVILMRAMEAASATLKERKKIAPRMDLFLNDHDASNTVSVDNVLKEIFPDSQIHATIRNLDYKVILERAIETVNQKTRKSFVFLDPFGYSDVSIYDIRRLLSSGNSEVLLWLPMSHMNRFSVKETPDALSRIHDELEITELELSEQISNRSYIALFTHHFKTNFSSRYVDSFFIKASPSTYHAMFFFTSHVRGAEILLEAKWKIDESNGEGWDHRQTNNLFGNSDKINKLEILLKDANNSPVIKGCTNSDLYEWTIRQGYLPKHCVDVLKTLYYSGLRVTLIEENKPAIKGSFYIAYEHYKNKPKVTIKLSLP